MPYRFTSRADGDARQLQDREGWAVVRQVHGRDVVVADAGGHHGDADAILSTTPGLRIAVRVADCAPVALLGEGVVGVVHAGWRGLAEGVVAAAVAEVRERGGGTPIAVIGPCIHAECYEFGADDLGRLVALLGPEVRGTTSWGTPALDLPAAVRSALTAAGVDEIEDLDVCTACSPAHWSHRRSGDEERQAVVAWI